MMDFLRVLPMPAADFLDEWFETPALKAALGVQGVAGGRLGPRASGTAFTLLYQAIGAGGSFRASRRVAGGTGQLAEALAQAARQKGAEICTGVGVELILLDGGRATGVLLSTGQEIQARAILSSAAPRHTFFDLVGAPNLEVRFVREVKNIRYRGALSKVLLALRYLPHFKGVEETAEGQVALGGRLLLCPSLDDLERASDAAKYGRIPDWLPLEMTLPAWLDNSFAPTGRHLMSVNVLYTPYHLKTGDWETGRESLGDQVIKQLETCAPGIGDLVLHRKVLTPSDYEREWGLLEGDIFHGEMGLDQLLFMRPVPGWAQYLTRSRPVPARGHHPGGDRRTVQRRRVANRSLS
jgi:phytoene dehydrogenase-like protein